MSKNNFVRSISLLMKPLSKMYNNFPLISNYSRNTYSVVSHSISHNNSHNYYPMPMPNKIKQRRIEIIAFIYFHFLIPLKIMRPINFSAKWRLQTFVTQQNAFSWYNDSPIYQSNIWGQWLRHDRVGYGWMVAPTAAFVEKH